MGEGTRLILGMVAAALIGALGLLFFAIDDYIPSARLEAAAQGASAEQAQDRMEQVLHGCRRRKLGGKNRFRQYRRDSIGTFTRSFPSIRNDKGWLAGTQVRCDAATCTVSSSAMIASPRASGACDGWPAARPGPAT